MDIGLRNQAGRIEIYWPINLEIFGRWQFWQRNDTQIATRALMRYRIYFSPLLYICERLTIVITLMNLSDTKRYYKRVKRTHRCLTIVFSGAIIAWWNHEALSSRAINTLAIGFVGVFLLACDQFANYFPRFTADNNVLLAPECIFRANEIPFTIGRRIFLKGLSVHKIQSDFIAMYRVVSVSEKNCPISKRMQRSEAGSSQKNLASIWR